MAGASSDTPPAFAAHLFSKRGRSFLFDAATRVSFEVDETGEAAARLLASKDRPAAVAPQRRQDSALASALDELLALQAEGHFGDFALRVPPLSPERSYEVAPIVSLRCNLRCRYCFSRQGGQLDMPRHVMEETARFIAAQTGAARTRHTLWVGSVGEPTAALARHQEFLSLVAEEGAAHGVAFTFGLGVTNLMALARPSVRRRLGDMMVGSVSVDGPPEAHDRMRVYPDGTGTYADAARGLESVRRAGGDPAAIATLTALFPDVSKVYFHLFDLGFRRAAVKPVRADPREPYAIGQNLDAICAGYDRFIDRLLTLPDDQLLKYLLVLLDHEALDYFARFLVRVIERHLVPRRCSAWTGSVAVDTDGQLYGCPCLLGMPEARVGSVWDGIDEPRVIELAERLHVSQRAPCRRCWARFLCGGGCMHQSYLTHGRFDPPDPSECKLNRHLIELAIWTYCELQRTRPAVLSALPTMLRHSWQDACRLPCPRLEAPSDPAAVCVALHRAAPPSLIRAQGHLKRRLPGPLDRRDLEVRLGWSPDCLFLLLTPRDAKAEGYWTEIRSIHLSLRVPKSMKGPRASDLPPLLKDLYWAVAARPGEAGVRYEETPRLQRHGEVVPGSSVTLAGGGYLLALPWDGIGLGPPGPEAEFGLQLVLVDTQAGHLQWFPDHEGGRVRLLRRGEPAESGRVSSEPGPDQAIAGTHIRPIGGLG